MLFSLKQEASASIGGGTFTKRKGCGKYPAVWRGFVYVLAILCVFRYVAEK